MKNSIIFAIVCVFVSLVVIVFLFGGPYKRMEFEKTKNIELEDAQDTESSSGQSASD